MPRHKRESQHRVYVATLLSALHLCPSTRDFAPFFGKIEYFFQFFNFDMFILVISIILNQIMTNTSFNKSTQVNVSYGSFGS